MSEPITLEIVEEPKRYVGIELFEFGKLMLVDFHKEVLNEQKQTKENHTNDLR